MKKWLCVLFVFLVLFSIGSYIGNWSNFQLRGTGLELRGIATQQQYVVDKNSGEVVFDLHVLDIARDDGEVFVLRLKATTFECGKGRILFTRYFDDFEVMQIDLESKKRKILNQADFELLWRKRDSGQLFSFESDLVNLNSFRKMNANHPCLSI